MDGGVMYVYYKLSQIENSYMTLFLFPIHMMFTLKNTVSHIGFRENMATLSKRMVKSVTMQEKSAMQRNANQ